MATTLDIRVDANNIIRDIVRGSGPNGLAEGTIVTAGASPAYLSDELIKPILFDTSLTSRITFNNSKLQFNAGPFTLQFWLKTPTWSTTYQDLVSSGSVDTTYQGSWKISIGNDELKWSTYRGTSDTKIFSAPFPANTWTHFALVRDTSSRGSYMALFVNGVLLYPDQIQYAYSALAGTGTAWIGGDGNSTSNKFNGYLYNFTVDDTALYAVDDTSPGNFTPPARVPPRVKSEIDYSKVPSSNISLLCSFDDAAQDSSSNATVLSAFGSPSIAKNNAIIGTGSAYLAAGTNSYYSIPVSSTQLGMGAGEFTIDAWIYPTAVNTNDLNTIVDLRQTTTSGAGVGGPMLAMRTSDRKIYFYNGGGNSAVISATAIPLNQWTHIGAQKVVRQLSTDWEIYINGTRDALATSTAALSTSGKCLIGTALDTPGVIRNFIGYIDQVAVVKGVALYPKYAASSFSLTRLGESFGDGGGNSVTVNNNAVVPGVFLGEAVATFPAITSPSGNINNRLTFSNENLKFGTGNFTIRFWVWRSSPVYGTHKFFSSGLTSGFDIDFTATHINWKVGTFTYSFAVPVGQWTHIAFVRIGAALRFYINGQYSTPVASGAGQSFGGTTGTAWIGGDGSNGGQYFSGYIKDFDIIDGELYGLDGDSFTAPTRTVYTPYVIVPQTTFETFKYTGATQVTFNTTGANLSRTKAYFTGSVYGMSTAVSLVAETAGIQGNSISLYADTPTPVIDVITEWNNANPTNRVVVVSGDTAQEMYYQAIQLSGAVSGVSITSYTIVNTDWVSSGNGSGIFAVDDHSMNCSLITEALGDAEVQIKLLAAANPYTAEIVPKTPVTLLYHTSAPKIPITIPTQLKVTSFTKIPFSINLITQSGAITDWDVLDVSANFDFDWWVDQIFTFNLATSTRLTINGMIEAPGIFSNLIRVDAEYDPVTQDVANTQQITVTYEIVFGGPSIPENQVFVLNRGTPLIAGENKLIVNDPLNDPQNLTVAIVNGNLPAGISFNPSNLFFSGIPTSIGEYVLYANATNLSGGDLGEGEVAFKIIVIDYPIEIVKNQVYQVLSNTAISQVIQYSGATPTSWNINNAPTGLTISNSGVLSGKISQVGTYNLIITADAYQLTDTEVVTLIIYNIVPVLSGNLNLTGKVGELFNNAIQYTGGTPTSWGYSNSSTFPGGVTLNLATGVLSGTPTQAGTFKIVNLFAQNGTGKSNLININLTIQTNIVAPIITQNQSFNLINSLYVSVKPLLSSAGGIATNWKAINLLPGLNINNSTGEISGVLTSTVQTNWETTVTATNSVGSSTAIVKFNVSLNGIPPTIAPNQQFNFTLGQAVSNVVLTFTGSNVLITATNFPKGLALNTSTGAISGKPDTLGIYASKITITNSAGSVVETVQFTILSNIVAPILQQGISDLNLIKNVTITPYTFINTGGEAISWIASNLPTGLSINAASGAITGKPLDLGEKTVSITASNSAGTSNTSFKIRVDSPLTAPEITDQTINKITNIFFNYSILVTGTVTFWEVLSVLPDGLSVNQFGLISGTIKTAGTNEINIKVSNERGFDTAKITINVVSNLLKPVILPNQTLLGIKGVLFNNKILTSGEDGIPTNWKINIGETLHPGLNLDLNNGVISGYPLVAGNSTTKIIAGNSAGDSTPTSVAIQIISKDNAPIITTNQLFTGTVGTAFNKNILFAGVATQWFIQQGSLPSGLFLDSSTGAIYGTPTAYSAQRDISIFAGNESGSDIEIIKITINETPLVIATNQIFTLYTGDEFTQKISYQGNPTTWSMSGLPNNSGLTINNGIISGTPAISGKYNPIITITGVSGISTSALIELNIISKIPKITSNQILTSATGKYFSKSISYTALQDAKPTLWSIMTANLPTGLFLDSINGVIKGTAITATSATGVECTIKVENSYGASTEKIKIVIENSDTVLKIAAGQAITATAGAYFEIIPTYVGTPTRWYMETLPPNCQNITINQNSGKVSGNIAVPGEYKICIYCENQKFDASAFINIKIT